MLSQTTKCIGNHTEKLNTYSKRYRFPEKFVGCVREKLISGQQ